MRKIILFLIFLLSVFPSELYCQNTQNPDVLNIAPVLLPDEIRPGQGFAFEIMPEIKDGWHINSNQPNSDYLIPSGLRLANNDSFFLESIQYPQSVEYEFDFADEPVSVFEDGFSVTGIIRADHELEPGTYKLPLEFTYQACAPGSCLKPETFRYTANIRVTGQPLADVENEIVKGADDADYTPSKTGLWDNFAGRIESAGLLLGLLLVFVGGLALNLTPCVYPIIPITISYFGAQSEGRTARLFILGLLYVTGMAVSYSLIGVITALTGSVFGGLLQHSAVLVIIAVFFILLALSMFGLYEFKLPKRWVDAAGIARTGFIGAMLMGLTMGIVAAPCIGPLVLGLVAYVAAIGDPVQGFLLFFFLALGLGMPYLFLALFSGKIKSLPSSGKWMQAVRHIFGLVLIGAAIFFVSPLLPGFLKTAALPVFGLVSAVFLLFFDKTAGQAPGFKGFKLVLSTLVIVLSAYALMPGGNVKPDWEEFSMTAYEGALENNRKMVIVFHADWCLPCQQLEKQTLSDPGAAEKLQKFKVFHVDMTHAGNPETMNIQQRFNVQGVPTMVLLDSEGNIAERIAGLISPAAFKNILSQVE